MKVLIVGASGWIGQKMTQALLDRGHLVATAPYDFIEERLRGDCAYYDWILNCAGLTGRPNVDQCETMKFETYEANAIYPIRLYRASLLRGAKFAHFSSGCIYEGDVFDVSAPPNFFGSTYSISKGISDRYLSQESDALVLRIRMPFSREGGPRDYLNKIRNYAQTGKLLDTGLNSMTDLDSAIACAVHLMEEGQIGPYNLVNHGAITMRELDALMKTSAQFFTPEEASRATVVGRSTANIMCAYKHMPDLMSSLVEVLNR